MWEQQPAAGQASPAPAVSFNRRADNSIGRRTGTFASSALMAAASRGFSPRLSWRDWNPPERTQLGGPFRHDRRNFDGRDHRARSSAWLIRRFGDRILGDAVTRLCIPSADGKHGDIAVFKTPHHPNFARDWTMPAVDIALATPAAPTFLRVHQTGGYYFIDGGVWANNPAMIAVVDALSCFNIERRQIRMLFLGGGSRKPKLGSWQLHLGGIAGWLLANGALIESMMHLSAMNADGQAGLLIGRDRLTRIQPEEPAAAVTAPNRLSVLIDDAQMGQNLRNIQTDKQLHCASPGVQDPARSREPGPVCPRISGATCDYRMSTDDSTPKQLLAQFFQRIWIYPYANHRCLIARLYLAFSDHRSGSAAARQFWGRQNGKPSVGQGQHCD
ncbi:MAG: patatin-like phospholipase family protein [Alphaproteobacteria bacterium]|nr:patatin-like phospholipase family protein [Alphaproteobacteria bacterium]